MFIVKPIIPYSQEKKQVLSYFLNISSGKTKNRRQKQDKNKQPESFVHQNSGCYFFNGVILILYFYLTYRRSFQKEKRLPQEPLFYT